ncbi:Predicted transcriptional regulator of sulfate adenylyltransferase, Rrf2 family, partial [uncultured Rubrobacteraceae bacterium]
IGRLLARAAGGGDLARRHHPRRRRTPRQRQGRVARSGRVPGCGRAPAGGLDRGPRQPARRPRVRNPRRYRRRRASSLDHQADPRPGSLDTSL